MKRRIVCFLALTALLCLCLLPAAAWDMTEQTSWQEGDQGPVVQEIRQRLIQLGYKKDKKNITHFTSQTTEAYLAFQRVNGFMETGVCSLIELNQLLCSTAVAAPVSITFRTLTQYANRPDDFATKTFSFNCRIIHEEPALGADLKVLCHVGGKTQLVLIILQDYWLWEFTRVSGHAFAPELRPGDVIQVDIAEIIGMETILDGRGKNVTVPVVQVRAATLRDVYFDR
ncbi:MAG: peptidoglycan-binding protein [Clostridia bacterium]|nr:peptidoglycan-binding protein [Clostridia bacterium]